MKKITLFISIFILALFSSQLQAQNSVSVSGEHKPAYYYINQDNNSARFNQYQDMREGFAFEHFKLDAYDTSRKKYLNFMGEKLLRDDQHIGLSLGNLEKRWRLDIEQNKTPNRISNKTMTPYRHLGNGLFTVPAVAPIIKDGQDETGTPSLVPTAAQMAVNDMILARYVDSYVNPFILGTQRNRTTATLNLNGFGPVKAKLVLMNEDKDGYRKTYGPIGDRPPRSLNAQLPEPVDFSTKEMLANVDYVRKKLQVQANYMLSVFNNKTEKMTWQNMFFAPDQGKDYIAAVAGTPRNVSEYGQRSLAPDNQAHNFSFTAGLDLPFKSRLTANAQLGFMKQNMYLLPYSFSTLGGDNTANIGDGKNWNDLSKLPRTRAEAEMQTLRIDLQYTISPAKGLNLRPYFNYYDLKNNTVMTEWRYVTQDAAGTNGAVDYRNYRKNLPYAFDRLRAGMDVRQYFRFWRSTVGLEFTRENINRDYREANTNENILEASLRTRPIKMLTLTAGYIYGSRTGDGYDYTINKLGYWYSFEQGENQVDNPQFLFANHPDLRRFDVSDRKRNEFRTSATYTTQNNVDINVSYRFRKDDFDSNVKPFAPLAGITVPLPNPDDANAMTPGLQLGLLDDARNNLSVNLQFVAFKNVTISLFADREWIDATQRGMVYNENARNQPSSPAVQPPTQLGPWTDPARLYIINTLETSNTVGGSLTYDLIPGKLRFLTDMNLSLSEVDLIYTGYGSDADYLGRDWETFQFGFNTPSTIKYNIHNLNVSLQYNVSSSVVLGLSYMYNNYVIKDWIQEPSGSWVEQIASEYMIRDTSRDNRWGNRVISMGGLQMPGYKVHIGLLTLGYRF